MLLYPRHHFACYVQAVEKVIEEGGTKQDREASQVVEKSFFFFEDSSAVITEKRLLKPHWIYITIYTGYLPSQRSEKQTPDGVFESVFLAAPLLALSMLVSLGSFPIQPIIPTIQGALRRLVRGHRFDPVKSRVINSSFYPRNYYAGPWRRKKNKKIGTLCEVVIIIAIKGPVLNKFSFTRIA
jgi:hypothetical protein